MSGVSTCVMIDSMKKFVWCWDAIHTALLRTIKGSTTGLVEIIVVLINEGKATKVLLIIIVFLFSKIGCAEPSTYFSESWYEGSENLKAAQQMAEESHADILLYFYTDWCKYCRQLEREMLNTEDVSSSASDIVKIKMNPEKDEGANRLMSFLHSKGYPGVMIRSAASKQFRHIYPFRKHDGAWNLESEEQFIEEMHSSNR